MQASQGGHVFLADGDEIELALRIPHGPFRDVDEDKAPVFCAAHALVRAGARFDGLRDVLPHLVDLVRRRDQVEDRTPDRLGARVAEDYLGSIVPEQNLARRRDGDQGVG